MICAGVKTLDQELNSVVEGEKVVLSHIWLL